MEDGGLRPGAGTVAGVKRQEARIFFSRDKKVTKERKRALARACAHGDNRSAKVPVAMYIVHVNFVDNIASPTAVCSKQCEWQHLPPSKL